MPLSFFAMMDLVMARRAPVRCDKWRSGVSAPGRCARIMSVFAAVVKKRCGAKLKMTQHQPLMDHKELSLAAAYPDAELGEKQLSFGRVFVFFKERFVNRLDKSICYQSIKGLRFICIQIRGPFHAPSGHEIAKDRQFFVGDDDGFCHLTAPYELPTVRFTSCLPTLRLSPAQEVLRITLRAVRARLTGYLTKRPSLTRGIRPRRLMRASVCLLRPSIAAVSSRSSSSLFVASPTLSSSAKSRAPAATDERGSVSGQSGLIGGLVWVSASRGLLWRELGPSLWSGLRGLGGALCDYIRALDLRVKPLVLISVPRFFARAKSNSP